MDLIDRLQLEHPVVQAALGGGLSRGELAGAVSAAGGLGQVATLSPDEFRDEIRHARAIAPSRPVAANLLMPFTRAAHVRVCIEEGVEAVSMFFGFSAQIVSELREANIFVIHQIGTPTEAKRAIADGADALIAQGIEAGGHLLAEEPRDDALHSIIGVAGGRPVLAAGGIVTADQTRAALDAGAAAVVAGTRFLLTYECNAHPEYQRRVLGADNTIETMLFGFGWPARHRVAPNAATDRWCSQDGRGSPLVTALNRPTGILRRFVPLRLAGSFTARQRPRVPQFGPGPPVRGMPDRVVDSSALYAGQGASEIHSVVPAAEAVSLLAP